MTTRERNKINDAVRALSQEEDVAMISDAASRISKPFNPDQSNLTSGIEETNDPMPYLAYVVCMDAY
jgi:hypothetical protein